MVANIQNGYESQEKEENEEEGKEEIEYLL